MVLKYMTSTPHSGRQLNKKWNPEDMTKNDSGISIITKKNAALHHHIKMFLIFSLQHNKIFQICMLQILKRTKQCKYVKYCDH
jgi:hypothetical protein